MARSIVDRDIVKLIPGLAILYLLLKAFVVANYSLTTAGALIVAAPLAVLVGTVTAYLNLAFLLIMVATAAWLFRRRAGTPQSPADPETKNIEAMAVGLLLASTLFLPWPFSISYFRDGILGALVYILAIGGLAVALWATSRMARRRMLGSSRSGLDRVATWLAWLFTPRHIIAASVVFLLLPTLNRPWVPAEVLVLRNAVAIQDSHLDDGRLRRSRYPVVYVLAQDGEWLTVLDADTRILLRLPIEEVAHRQVCRHREQPPGSVPIWSYLTGFRYDSPNTMCHTLVNDHDELLDPLVSPLETEQQP